MEQRRVHREDGHGDRNPDADDAEEGDLVFQVLPGSRIAMLAANVLTWL